MVSNWNTAWCYALLFERMKTRKERKCSSSQPFPTPHSHPSLSPPLTVSPSSARGELPPACRDLPPSASQLAKLGWMASRHNHPVSLCIQSTSVFLIITSTFPGFRTAPLLCALTAHSAPSSQHFDISLIYLLPQ